MNNLSFLSLLSTDGFILTNKKLAINLGILEAVIIGELASEYIYWSNAGKLETIYNKSTNEWSDQWFFSTVENIKNNTGINDSKQRIILTKLQSLGIIDLQLKGIPAKRYIRINTNKIIDLLETREKSRSVVSKDLDILKPSDLDILKVKDQDLKKLDGNNNIYNKNNKNNNINNNKNKTNLSDSLSVNKTNFENNDIPSENENNTQLEGGARETVIKNKLLLNQREEVSVSNILSEKMSNINNEEARKNQVQKAMMIEEKKVKRAEGKKKGRMNQLNKISEEVMNDTEIEKLLETYLSDFEQMTGGFPGNASWRKRLENLKTLAENNRETMIEIINLAITKGWKDFYKPQKFDNSPAGRPSFDTMSNYEHVKGVAEMTSEERAAFLSEDNLSSEEF